MESVLSTTSAWWGALARNCGFVWHSWRGITAREWRLALLLGAGIGTLQGISMILVQQKFVWWRNFLSCFVDAVIPTIALLLCLAVARNVRVGTRPVWFPFVAAALAAAALDRTVGVLLKVLVFFVVVDPSLWPGLEMEVLHGQWINLPPILFICLLASLGYMYARDAQRRQATLRSVQVEQARLNRESYESRLQAMQARVEPQFLFDTLRQVERLYEVDPGVAERVLDDLITYLRAVLPNLHDSKPTVAAELTVSRAWLDIMKVRSNGRLTFTISSTPEVDELRMPPMVLLPLVGAAMRAVMSSLQPSETIAVQATLDSGRLRIVVTDSARAFADVDSGEAIAEVGERLRNLYAREASVTFEIAQADWTQAIVDLPAERG